MTARNWVFTVRSIDSAVLTFTRGIYMKHHEEKLDIVLTKAVELLNDLSDQLDEDGKFDAAFSLFDAVAYLALDRGWELADLIEVVTHNYRLHGEGEVLN